MGTRVSRFDFCRIDAARVSTTSQGFLIVPGRLTRVGVLDYYRQDGSVYRELRLPEEVFRADSLQTLAGAPVTDLHGGMVSPDNIQALGVGLVGSDVEGGSDGAFVTGTATIQRRDTVKAVQDRSRTELSPGYECWVQDEGGVWDGSAYGLGRALKFDGTQRDIQYNHLAIGPKDWGRSGPDVALRMDGLAKMGAFARCDGHGNSNLGGFLRERLNLTGRPEAEVLAALQMERSELGMILDGFMMPERAMLEKFSGLIDVPVDQLEGMIPDREKGEAPINPRPRQDRGPAAVITTGHNPMKTIVIVMDGIQYEVQIAESLATTFASSLEKQRTDAAELQTIKGELLVVKKDAADLKVELATATDPAALQAHINARTQLVQDAAKIAPELKVDGSQSTRDLKVAALVANGFGDEMFTEKTDSAFIDGVFTAAVAKADAAPDAAPSLRVVPGPVLHTDEANKPKTPEELETPVSADTCTAAHSDAARERMMGRGRDASSQPISNSMTREDAQRR